MCRGLSTFCGILTLQVGVTVLAAVFLLLGAIVLVANVFEGGDESSFSYPMLIIIAFAIGLIIIGLLAFFSAYNESRGLAILALLVLMLLVAFWVLLCILSLLSKPTLVETVCRIPKKLEKELRCPESLWIADLDYRKAGGGGSLKAKREVNQSEAIPHSSSLDAEIHQFLNDLRKLNLCLRSCCEENQLKNRREKNYDSCNSAILQIFSRIDNGKRFKKGLIDFTETSNRSSPMVDASNEMQFHLLQKYAEDLLSGFLGTFDISPIGVIGPSVHLPLEANITEPKQGRKGGGEEESKYKSGIPLYAAIGLFIANLLFFLFTAIILWSWAQELGDDCAVVVENYFY